MQTESAPGCVSNNVPGQPKGLSKAKQAHSEACRKAARLAAGDERINRALAGAVERHAAKDPGVRGTQKRASATCHPESEHQKKIALDTEQESTPRPFGLAWRIIRIRHTTEHRHKDCTGYRHE